jgi:hypothetical protein
MTNTMKTQRKQVFSVIAGLVVLSALAVQTGFAAQAGVEANPLREIKVPSGVDITSDAPGSKVLVFEEIPSSVIPPDREVILNASNSGFSGSYSGAGILGMCFRVRSDDGIIPGTYDLRLGVTDSLGRGGQWIYENIRFEGAGMWATNTVCFDRRVGWNMNLKGWSEQEVDALWADTLNNVVGVSLTLQQRGRSEQSYVLDDVILCGEGYMPPHAKLAVGLLNNFGVQSLEDLDPDQLTQDSNRDGTSDVAAIAAGQDPGLAITISSETGGVAVEWPCVDGMRYTVLRADSLMGGFVPVASGLEATENGIMTHVDANVDQGQGPYFYKVTKSW